MKTAFLIFFALVISFGSYAANNYIDSAGTVQTRHAQYLKVKNSAASALTKGQAVCLDRADDDGINVEYCANEGDKPVGVVTDTSCAVGAFCKLQTKGFFAEGDFDYLATATAAGGMIYAGTDGDLVVPATRTVDMSPVGVVLDAHSADSTAVEIYIDL